MPVLKLSKRWRGWTLPNSLYEDIVTLILKPDKNTSRKENRRPISILSIDEKKKKKDQSSTKYLGNSVQQYIKSIIRQEQVGFIPGFRADSATTHPLNFIHHI